MSAEGCKDFHFSAVLGADNKALGSNWVNMNS